MRATFSSVLVTPVPPGAPLAGTRPPVIYVPSDIGAAWASSHWTCLVLAGVVVLAGVAVIAIVLLRRRPLTALALLLAGSLTSAPATGSWPAGSHTVALDPEVLLLVPVLFLLAGAAVSFIAATRPRRVSVAAAAVALGVQVGGWAAASGPFVQVTRRGPASFLGSPPELPIALITIVAWLIGHSIRQAHIHSQALSAQADAEAANAERLSIARDLHDMVAHSVGIIAIQAGMARRVIDTQPAEARDALAAIEATSRETLAGLRRTVGALRQTGPRTEADIDSVEAPGLADLTQLLARTRGAGVRVELCRRGQPRALPAEVDTSAFRIIQEALANVVRHAGTAHCRVSIDQRDEKLSIEVTDDGCGTTVGGTGYGIAGMRERAALLHGQLSAGPQPEGGFRVMASLPLPAEAALSPAAADQLPVAAALG